MPTHDFVDIGDVLGFELLQGTIKSVDESTDTCTVTVGSSTLDALLFYHCKPDSILRANGAIEGAALGFFSGDEVVVLKQSSGSSIKVIGHIDGIRRCGEQTGYYFVFYNDNGEKVALCTYDNNELSVVDTKIISKLLFNNEYALPILFHAKRFTHAVPVSGVDTKRNLYFISTTLYINSQPYIGWESFASANPTFPLVTNNATTKIIITEQVAADLQTVNQNINHANSYVHEPSGNDNWHIMGAGESGDCEDFALTKAKALLDLGYPASALHIEVGYYEDTPASVVGHAWLVVQTTSGNYALDLNSDEIVPNDSMSFGGKPFYFRQRQTGVYWAHVFGYGWLNSSLNLVRYIFYYVYDPVVGIFYRCPFVTDRTYDDQTNDYGLPFANIGGAGSIYESGVSINFSEDAKSIYWAKNSNSWTLVNKLAMTENALNLVSSETLPVTGFVQRDGTISVDPYYIDDDLTIGYACDVISPDGYYDYKWDECYRHQVGESTSGFFHYIHATFFKEFGDPFKRTYLFSPTEVMSPFGEEYTDPSPMADIYAYCWNATDAGLLLLQSFMWDGITGQAKRIYKDGVDITSYVADSVGTTEDNVLGFIYIPISVTL